jgi:hypothetical protein
VNTRCCYSWAMSEQARLSTENVQYAPKTGFLLIMTPSAKLEDKKRSNQYPVRGR